MEEHLQTQGREEVRFGVGTIDDMSFVCLLAIFALSLELNLLLLQVGVCFRGLLEVL